MRIGSGLRTGIFCAAFVGLSLAGGDGAARAQEMHHPTSGGALPAGPGDGSGTPIMLEYACGTRFVVTSAYQAPITLRYEVVGKHESGTIKLPAAPMEEPGISEAVLDTKATGTVALSRAGRQVAQARNDRVPCVSTTPKPLAAAEVLDPAVSGQWSAPFSWPAVAVHLTLLPDGRVMSWGAKVSGAPRLWTPGMGGFTSAQAPDLVFCAGQSFLPDGRLLVAGGTITSATFGRPQINIFDAFSNSWTRSTSMRWGRWYPTNTTMGNGDVVITAGTDEKAANVAIAEVWSATGTVRQLAGASLKLPYYPRTFLAPNGKLFYAGEQRMSRYLDVSGDGAWTNVGNRKFGARGYGSAAMYAPGKILYAGGARTTNTAEIIDLNKAKPAWSYTQPMAYARRQFNLTILADGKLLATDGVQGTAFNDLTKPVFAAEMWDPATGAWTTLASSTIPRGYHGSAILLPDGTVLQSGGGNGSGAPNQKNAEIFSPPYLFAGPRPTLGSAPAEVGYGASFEVATPDADAITRVSLIALGTATHAFNMGQRYQALDFAVSGGGLTVTGPTSPNLTPPGYYMLFLINGAGVPSIAKFVKVA